ncbi:MAG: epoxyqueuosine reductase QueH [Oscillospiraceae bacterium]|nr:epoxyqueuosine reductase QueH [Oscillospiraceae bacterium]
MNRNYQKELDRIIQRQEGRRPRLLLHSCCGVCSSAVLEYLAQYFELTLLWYNPNLYPEAEYERRLAALREIIEKMGLADRVALQIEPWRSEDYRARTQGLENEPEGGARCTECFRLRLRETARAARQGGYDFFCTTLTLSRHKDAALINALGEQIAREEGAVWLPADFKKQGREMRATELSEQYGIYRQLYCGCEYSLQRREQKESTLKKNEKGEET